MSSNTNFIHHIEFRLKLIPIACAIISIPKRNFWCQKNFEATEMGCTHSCREDARLFLGVPHQKFQHQELSWYPAFCVRKLRCEAFWWLSEAVRLWGTWKLEYLGRFEGKMVEIHGRGRFYRGEEGRIMWGKHQWYLWSDGDVLRVYTFNTVFYMWWVILERKFWALLAVRTWEGRKEAGEDIRYKSGGNYLTLRYNGTLGIYGTL